MSCWDETSEVRGTRSECRVVGSSRAVAVTDVGRACVCACTALADRRRDVVKRKNVSYLPLDLQTPRNLVAGVHPNHDWLTWFVATPFPCPTQQCKKSINRCSVTCQSQNNLTDFFWGFFPRPEKTREDGQESRSESEIKERRGQAGVSRRGCFFSSSPSGFFR